MSIDPRGRSTEAGTSGFVVCFAVAAVAVADRTAVVDDAELSVDVVESVLADRTAADGFFDVGVVAWPPGDLIGCWRDVIEPSESSLSA